MTPFPDIRTASQLVQCVAEGAQPRFLFFWGHRPGKNGLVTASCFSQWYEAPFTIDGVPYPSAEHYMMASKAALFGESGIRDQVLTAATPAHAKALGRQIAGFDDAVWERERMRIVVEANVGKFGQNATLRDYLVQTGEQVLVEASPVDCIWGIGLAADHPDAANPSQWQGLNLLGFALMEVRARLASTKY